MMKVYINDIYINNTNIILTRPLEIEISELEECEDIDLPDWAHLFKHIRYIVINEEFNNFGNGETIDDAIDNLKHDFDYYYKKYGTRPDEELNGELDKELKQKILEILGAGEGTIWTIPVREMIYDDAKKEILSYRNNFNHNAGIAELAKALWIDIELIMQIIENLDKEHQFRWI